MRWRTTSGESSTGRENLQGICDKHCSGYRLVYRRPALTQPYASAQYVALSRLIVGLTRVYPSITPERIVGHSDVAPGRKTDPGIAFDWPLLRTLIRYEVEVAPA